MLVDLTSQDKSTGQVRKPAMAVATGIGSEPQNLLVGMEFKGREEPVVMPGVGGGLRVTPEAGGPQGERWERGGCFQSGRAGTMPREGKRVCPVTQQAAHRNELSPG